MLRTMRSRLLSGAAVLAVAGAALGMALAPDQNDETENAQSTSETIRVGTLEPQMAFQQYHRISELVELQMRLEQEAQQAQQEQNHERLMELQQEMQAGQMRIIEAFQADMERVMPEIAEEHGIKIVAVDVIYSGDDVESMDLTQQIVERINADAPEAEEPGEPAFPGFPQ